MRPQGTLISIKMDTNNERKQERLGRRRERERQARAQETAEQKETRLAKRRERYRARRTEGNLITK